MQEDKFRISIGKNPADDKWYGQCTLPDGKVLSTAAFDTHKQCRDQIEKFLQSKGIKYTFRALQ